MSHKLFLTIFATTLTLTSTSSSLSSPYVPTASASSSAIPAPPRPQRKLAVLFNSNSPHYSHPLFQSTFLALRYAESADQGQGQDQGTLTPQFIDLAEIPESSSSSSTPSPSRFEIAARWLQRNQTLGAVSLLDSDDLSEFTREIQAGAGTGPGNPDLKIFTPFQVPNRTSGFRSVGVYSLQPNGRALAAALLDRVSRVGCTVLVPVLDDPTQLGALDDFRKVAPPSVQVLDPIFFVGGLEVGQFRNLSGTAAGNETIGVLLLSATDEGRKKLAGKIARESEAPELLRWFSPELLPHPEGGPPLFGLYSVVYVGAGQWDNPDRRRLLMRLNQFTGPNPLILPAVLAYDAVFLANLHAKGTLDFERPLIGMSGEIEFNSAGDRVGGVYFGVSAIPHFSHLQVPSPLLQPSNWVFEDMLNVGPAPHQQMAPPGHFAADYQIFDHQSATASVLTRQELLAINVTQAGNGRLECSNETLEVTTHDPFNQMTYLFTFNRTTLPDHLLIPNQYGFGLTFSCASAKPAGDPLHDDDDVVSLKVACTPYGRSLGEPVHCFRSNVRQSRSRTRNVRGSNAPQQRGPKQKQQKQQARQFFQFANSRDGDTYAQYQSPAPSMTYPAYYGGVDTSTPGSMTTRLDVPISEEPPSTPPPPPGTSKLPELRQIIKAAKPFVGSCIGASAGCALCVLVLGRLPLGAVPAACTGPCFVGTFGSCGSLLGRVFAETTIICTELFRQGFLDIDTFIADAEYGRHLRETSPMTLQGYRMLATPLVGLMQRSTLLTKTVALFALPWSHHMKYMMGYTEEWSFVGWAVHLIGYPFCNLAGWISGDLERSSDFQEGAGSGVVNTFLTWFLVFLLIVWRHAKGQPK